MTRLTLIGRNPAIVAAQTVLFSGQRIGAYLRHIMALGAVQSQVGIVYAVIKANAMGRSAVA